MGESQRRGARPDPRAGAHLSEAGTERTHVLVCDPADKRKLELQNQAELFEFIVQVSQDDYEGQNPFTDGGLRHLHRLTVQGIYPCGGEWRSDATDQVQIKASFTPHQPAGVRLALPDLMDQAYACKATLELQERQLPASDRDQLRPHLRLRFCCDLFYQMLVIHPFRGGNGRVSRAFLHLLLYKLDVLEPPLNMFGYMAYRRKQYLEVLRAADAGDREPLYAYVWRGRIEARIYDLMAVLEQDDYRLLQKIDGGSRRFLRGTFRHTLSDSSHQKAVTKVTEELRNAIRRKTR